MRIKKKLFLGFGLLFIVVLVFGAVSLYYIEVISKTASITLKNNYQTLTFTRAMRSVLDEQDLPLNSLAAGTFDLALKKQENNITEHGEREATSGVRYCFGVLTNPSSGLNEQRQAEKKIRSLLTTIDGLNMQAIVSKNDSTHATVNKATLYLGSMVLITFFILFILIAGFPGFILNPLEALIEALQEISRKNYDARLDFKGSEEFARLANAFNTMAVELGTLENASLSKVLAAENRVTKLIEETPDAIIGTNEKAEVLFMNSAAKQIFNLGDHAPGGQPLHILPGQTGLLKEITSNKDPEHILEIKRGGKIVRFQQKNLEINVPNLKIDFDSLQMASYPAGIIYLLKEIHE
ncbi:HAMP domain-containing protein [Mucilaginibacter mallensis]|uniref:histidine kinase n=1 Tax=Mucilaginibacter mallensis TaxID=652787 RepID=A0A1H1QAS1_MUCMA|nr:HAMP domain-containing protein [Mucilaginibacter mallensis]SDS20592.1 HAMP domain-containing protein [Mucilaginibacter mallensis]